MCFEDQLLFGVEDVAQLGGGAALVVDDVEVVELDAGLHHQGNDARPDVFQTQFGEGRPVRGDRSPGTVGWCRDQAA
jgi:hypothetical protein